MDLIKAATMDAYVEREAIAKCMDALGPILSDIDPSLMHLAIAFRNGPMLGDLRHPVNTYLQKDPVPVTWYFEWEEVMRWDAIDISLRNNLIHTAHERALEKGYLPSYGPKWCGRVHDRIENGHFVSPALAWRWGATEMGSWGDGGMGRQSPCLRVPASPCLLALHVAPSPLLQQNLDQLLEAGVSLQFFDFGRTFLAPHVLVELLDQFLQRHTFFIHRIPLRTRET